MPASLHPALVRRGSSITFSSLGVPIYGIGVNIGTGALRIAENIVLGVGTRYGAVFGTHADYYQIGFTVLKINPNFTMTVLQTGTITPSNTGPCGSGGGRWWFDPDARRLGFVMFPQDALPNRNPYGSLSWTPEGVVTVLGGGEMVTTGAQGEAASFVTQYATMDDHDNVTVVWQAKDASNINKRGRLQWASLNLTTGATSGWSPFASLQSLTGAPYELCDWANVAFDADRIRANITWAGSGNYREFHFVFSNGACQVVDTGRVPTFRSSGFYQVIPTRPVITRGRQWGLYPTPITTGVEGAGSQYTWGYTKIGAGGVFTGAPSPRVSTSPTWQQEYTPSIWGTPQYVGDVPGSGNFEIAGIPKQTSNTNTERTYAEVSADLSTVLTVYPMPTRSSTREFNQQVIRTDTVGNFRLGWTDEGSFYIYSIPAPNGCTYIAQGKVKITHTKGGGVKPCGLALVEPYYHVFTTQGVSGAGQTWEMEFEPGTELKFRLLDDGVAPGDAAFNSDVAAQAICAINAFGCFQFQWEDINASDPTEIYSRDGNYLDATTTICAVVEEEEEEEPVEPAGRHGYTLEMEKGWPMGRRTTYDDVFIIDEVGWNDILWTDVVPLDDQYALALYAREDYNIVEMIEERRGLDLTGVSDYSLDVIVLFGALLKRSGDALLTVKKDVFIDFLHYNSGREGFTSAPLNTTDAALGYVRWAYLDQETGSYGRAATSVIRRVGENIEVVGTKVMWSDFDGAWWYPSYERNIWSIVPLTDKRYVVLGLGMTVTLDMDRFYTTGEIYNNVTDGQEGRPYTAWVADLNGNSLKVGPENLVGTCEANWTTMHGAKVNEDRIVVVSDLEDRAEFQPYAKVNDTNLHWLGPHLRTLDISGTTVTENKHNGAFMPELFTEFYDYMTAPVVEMFNDTEGVLLYNRHADVNPPYRYRVGNPNDPLDSYNPERYDEPSLEHLNSVYGRYTTEGMSGVAWPTHPGEAEHPAALRFSVAADGAITVWPLSHILDITPVLKINQSGREDGTAVYGGSTKGWIMNLALTAKDGLVLASWGVDQDHQNLPVEWKPPEETAMKATWLILDDETPSGFKPTGYRHLGISPVWPDGSNVVTRPKFFPGTDWAIGSALWDGWHGSFIYDGPGLSPEYFQGFPEPEDSDDLWSEWSGYYAVNYRPYVGYDPVTYQNIYGPASPNETKLVWDDWEETGMKHRLGGHQYGEDPWDLISTLDIWDYDNYGEIYAQDGTSVDVLIWRISPPPADATAQPSSVTISRHV